MPKRASTAPWVRWQWRALTLTTRGFGEAATSGKGSEDDREWREFPGRHDALVRHERPIDRLAEADRRANRRGRAGQCLRKRRCDLAERELER